jgi:hypothetical protein
MNALNRLKDFLVKPAYADAESIDPRGVAYVESRGATPERLRTPGPHGELGKYQMTPMAWKDLLRVYPKKYKDKDMFTTLTDDNTSLGAMQDYLKILEGYLKTWGLETDDSSILQMYNVGPGKFKKGTRNPNYFQTYLRGLE